MKAVLKQVVKSAGYRIVPVAEDFAHQRSRAMKDRQIDLVIDVGANMGQYGSGLRESGYEGSIWSFEPLSQAYRELQRVAGRDGGWTTCRTAVGEAPGKLPINIAGNGQSSSLFPMLKAHADAAPESQYVGTEMVEVVPLDDLWGKQLPRSARAMLKLDTQGYEGLVIRGARSVVAEIQIIECEMSFVPLYEGQMLFHEMYLMITQLGFRLIGLEPALFDKNTNHFLQVDGLFARQM
jgi:FkbM family methyltransferase